MRLGICGGLEIAPLAAQAGYDYLELNVQGHLRPLDPDDVFLPILDQIQQAPLPPEAANCFVPGTLKITGPDADLARLQAYSQTAFSRAAQAGIKTIVFGSGGARQIPDEFPREKAWEQLVAFGAMIAPLAVEAGITVVVEPLNRAECNVLTTVAESAHLVREVDHPGLRLLIDAYHWGKDSDSYDDLVAAGPLLRHAHIATYLNRRPTGQEPCDFGPFFAAMREAGYNGRISLECSWQELSSQAAPALAALRALAAK